jgi:serine O-acetyltransferase
MKNLDDIIRQISGRKDLFPTSQQCSELSEMPSIINLREIVVLLRKIFFPGYFDAIPHDQSSLKYYVGDKINHLSWHLSNEVLKGFECIGEYPDGSKGIGIKAYSEELTYSFIKTIPIIRDTLLTDVIAIYEGDPAAKNFSEIIYCYPGVKAIMNYRIAHGLKSLGIPVIPRIISEMAHSETGIDIHPCAEIGHHFAIDHGTGIVIGETCVIGSHVKIYQGVTLGAKSFTLDDKGKPVKGIPRHPIVEDNVVIYSGATILGRILIGANSIIGGNVWITENVPANSKLTQNKLYTQTFNDGGGI